MRKILLNLHVPKTAEQVQRYLALEFDFPDYYGENLDALYDMLTCMTEDTCVGIFEPKENTELSEYVSKVKRVFQDAEEENPHLCVIFSELEENVLS